MVGNVREFEIASILSEATEILEDIQCPVEYDSSRNFKKSIKNIQNLSYFYPKLLKLQVTQARQCCRLIHQLELLIILLLLIHLSLD